MRFDPVILEGTDVRLEPLTRGHLPELCDAIRDGELWKLHVTSVPHPENIGKFFEQAEEVYTTGEGLPFATIEKVSGRVVGSTRFMHTDSFHNRTEIGYTFIGKSLQRTGINTEAKLLMLTHAFESLEMNRVEFLTDYFNSQSRKAIARLGAKQEGILRNHMIMRSGRIRDSVIFSIIRSEWPGVKEHLKELRAFGHESVD
ncbi:MAG: GNAT family N-acetyltransferase [Pyrinomonadaceae bacterium]|nr:GNAT family N-acetyltransferase [Pyrinomonadaceae bacterium]